MTWSRATLVLVLAIVFDALRAFFELFWFFGPAIAAFYCTSATNDVVGTSVSSVAGKVVAVTCSAASGVAGFFAGPALVAFGVVMAMAIGFLGWMTIGLIIIMTNPRILKENKGNGVWFIASLLISELPIIDALPSFTITLFRMYSVQIKTERKAWQEYEKAHLAEQRQERDQQIAEYNEARATQLAQLQEQEALYEQESNEGSMVEQYRMDTEAENDASYTPDVRKVA